MRWLLRLVIGLMLLAGVYVSLPVAGGVHAETVIERMTSPGPLSTAHAKLEAHCNTCHLSFHRQAQDRQCLACHTGIARDIATQTRWHGLVPKARTQPCSSCHAEHHGSGKPALTVFDRATFHHDTQSAYRLTGAHARTACASCHTSKLYRETPQACASCHARADVHQGRLQACAGCHTTTNWRQVLPFDHDRTRYPLTGAHRTTPCAGCHVNQQWHGVSTECVSCHVRKDVHRGADGPKCASCHLTTNWRTVVFDHDTVKAFPLVGAHRAVACAGCHAKTARPDKAPVACAGCHGKDDVHRGSDGPKCADCHSQTTWKIATFDHAKTSFPLVGAHVKVACTGCHTGSVDKVRIGGQCIDCHRKDDVHRASLGPLCERCHKQTSFIIPGIARITAPRPGTATKPGDFPRSGLKP
ncbi:cytochrome c family protein [Novosphingobium sp.]|uniref:cytochrome c family protein n=1 Tax=Novosphingobium sp. TaxID=1874826 RepID=UPI003D0C7FBE